MKQGLHNTWQSVVEVANTTSQVLTVGQPKVSFPLQHLTEGVVLTATLLCCQCSAGRRLKITR